MKGKWNGAHAWSRHWLISGAASLLLVAVGQLMGIADRPCRADEPPAGIVSPAPSSAAADATAVPSASDPAPAPDSAADSSGPAEATATELAEKDEYYQLLRNLADAIDQVERNYVKEISKKELIEAAINGVLSKLDEYSDFIPEEQYDGFQKEVENRFHGVGVQIGADPGTGLIRVISPLIGSPAYRAGVLSGDLIVRVDGQEVKGKPIDDVIEMMQGPESSRVVLTISRATQNEPLEITVERGEVRVETVLGYERRSDDSWSYFCDSQKRIGYVRISAFSEHTPGELKAALDQLQKEKMVGLVLDLRFNPGGMLGAAVEVADLFLDKGTIVSAEGRNVPKRVWEAQEPDTIAPLPLAVLVNHYSASAAEIVAAALQDHARAVIIGERTWGKGSVQNLVQLDGGRGAIKITTASYLRPSGKNIHRFSNASEDEEWGVKPNEGFEVAMRSREQVRWLEWRKLQDLAHGTQGNAPAAGPTSPNATTPPDNDSAASSGNGGRRNRPADPQLDRATTYVAEQIDR